MLVQALFVFFIALFCCVFNQIKATARKALIVVLTKFARSVAYEVKFWKIEKKKKISS